MATIKAYTDLSQSKALSKILPPESADMCYILHATSDNLDWRFDDDVPPMVLGETPINKLTVKALPCWSLSALFKFLPVFTEPTAFSVNVSVPSITKTENGWLLKYDGDFTLNINNGKDTEAPVELLADNPIDAAFEMVCWLKENGKI